jgi:hypothetical protein
MFLSKGTFGEREELRGYYSGRDEINEHTDDK